MPASVRRLRSWHPVAACRFRPPTPEDDDVIDPYGRSWQTYERSAAQLVPALDEVVRVLRVATR